MHLESRRLAPGNMNVRLEAVRRLADCGLLRAGWAAGIRRVRAKLSGRLQIATGSRANGIGRCLQCFLLVGSSPRTRRADRAHAGERYCGHFDGRVRESSSGDGADGGGVAHSVTREAVQASAEPLKRCGRNAGRSSRFWCYRHFGAPLRCHPRSSVISWTGSIAGW